MRARRAGNPPRAQRGGGIGADTWRGGGPARLGTVVSCPTARAARPGAQRRDTPTPCFSKQTRPSLRIRGRGPISFPILLQIAIPLRRRRRLEEAALDGGLGGGGNGVVR